MKRLIPGVGPVPCPLLFAGEAPGPEEDKRGIPFVPYAPSGKILSERLFSIRLKREDVYITNIYKSILPDNRDPKPEEIIAHEPYLISELQEVQPEIVVALGRVAARWFLGDVDMDRIHGIPFACSKAGLDFTVLPVYHPAAGLHNSEMAQSVIYGFEQLDLLLKGKICAGYLKDEYPQPDYREVRQVRLSDSPVACDTEGHPSDVWSVQVSQTPGTGYLIRPDHLDRSLFRGRNLIFHHALHDLDILQALGMDLTDCTFDDTMVMAYLLCTEPKGLKSLAYRHCGMEMASYPDIVHHAVQRHALHYFLRMRACQTFPAKLNGGQGPRTLAKRAITDYRKKKINLVHRFKHWSPETRTHITEVLGPFKEAGLPDVRPQSKALTYAARDPDATIRVYNSLKKKIEASELQQVYALDTGIIPMVLRMHQVGMPVDLDHFAGLKSQFASTMKGLRQKISDLSGGQITNPGSGDQAADFLFGTVGLKVKRWTKKRTRPAVENKVLESIRQAHPVVPALLEYKELEKLRGTYVEGLVKWVRDGRLHPNLSLTGTATGRLACSQPNLMAIPTRTKMGKLIRSGFVTSDDKVLISVDFGQLELRVLAHESQDPSLLKVYRDGLDLHDNTERMIFGTSRQNRIPSKTGNFSVIYGVTSQGLKWSLIKNGIDWPLDRCQEFIDEWFRAYPGVARFMEEKKAECRRYGYVRDMWGRRRYIPNIKSPKESVRLEAEREAANFPIQSGAGGIMKSAMISIWNDVMPVIWKSGYAECLLQVHDELIFEVEKRRAFVLYCMTRHAMESAVELRVPLEADGKYAQSWGELK